ncbi:DUF6980 family protein [Saccharospirillum impatiens]|uniref:DUF6980 family protein n=1 Tax=Saccharospirillum impatiens TaxID=169438 RepID=UPI0012FBBC38|nr:hypothetical protein [Saccharospirillum impatiens]
MISNKILSHCCSEMDVHLDQKDVPIFYEDKYREYGIKVLDGGSARQTIKYCPWCGKELPKILRNEWFDYLEKNFGFTNGDDPAIPEVMKSGAWWRKDNL